MEEQKTATRCYEAEMQAQRAITEINRWKGLKAKK